MKSKNFFIVEVMIWITLIFIIATAIIGAASQCVQPVIIDQDRSPPVK